MSDQPKSRRDVLKNAAAAGLGLMAASTVASASASSAKPKKIIPIDFKDPIWNREAKARLESHTDANKFVFGTGTGVVCGVRDNEKVKELMRFEVFSTIRLIRQPDNSYQRLCREVVLYRDLKTNEIMNEWDNPYTGERVRVVDVANDPFNYTISEYFPQPPSYGGLNKSKPVKRPFLLNWGVGSGDTITLEADIHLFYPSALQPEKWPRESPGKMSRVSEMFRYFIRREDLENPELTHVPSNLVWSRITPWLPWMLMDQAQGHITYLGNMGTRQSLAEFPEDTVAYITKHYPKYLAAPTEWEEPSLSSLEHYALEQTPAAPRKK